MAALIDATLRCLSRLYVSSAPAARTLTTQTSPLLFRATAVLGAEPMKRKKKSDITLVVMRENRKRRKLEKEIRRVMTRGRRLKPIEEIEGELQLYRTVEQRKRAVELLTFEEGEQRASLLKQWNHARRQLHVAETHTITSAIQAQQQALQELRAESEDLYQLALQCDEGLTSFYYRGPTETPPNPAYEAPDGDYIDTTKKYDKRL